ncbi:YdcF family protein [Leptodesmis sp.]|uniref:YdcF family protein n=1 Tax=Leptodesmis sp. TaxID=3100501 RepID=UPI0040535A51
MFLFLSKLLPIFLYPLGLSCLLLLLAFILLWWKPRLAAVPVILALVLLLVSSSAWASDWLVRSLEYQYVPQVNIPKADAIVVLGGATRPAVPPRPWVEVAEEGDRVLYAAKLFREGKAPRIILSGGRVNWAGNNDLPESADMAELIKTMGVPETVLIQESTSRNTRENAVNSKKIMDDQGIRSILLVTSALHMPRSLRIFQKLGIQAFPATTDFLSSDRETRELQNTAQDITLNSLPDAERLRNTTRALKEYVGICIYWLRGWL